jgi:hypothetical protein
MEARIVGFRWDPERRQTVFDAVDAANALEHMGVGERFTVAESRIGPERDSAYPGWLHNGPLSEDPVFIRVDFEDMTHKP